MCVCVVETTGKAEFTNHNAIFGSELMHPKKSSKKCKRHGTDETQTITCQLKRYLHLRRITNLIQPRTIAQKYNRKIQSFDHVSVTHNYSRTTFFHYTPFRLSSAIKGDYSRIYSAVFMGCTSTGVNGTTECLSHTAHNSHVSIDGGGGVLLSHENQLHTSLFQARLLEHLHQLRCVHVRRISFVSFTWCWLAVTMHRKSITGKLLSNGMQVTFSPTRLI